jgi:hypothetical protein
VVRALVDRGIDIGTKEEVISERFSSIGAAGIYRDLAMRTGQCDKGKVLKAWVSETFEGKS